MGIAFLKQSHCTVLRGKNMYRLKELKNTVITVDITVTAHLPCQALFQGSYMS